MEVITPPKQVFMKKFQRFEPKVQDHSAMILFKTCERLYFYRVVLGFVEKVSPQYFGFGSCYHKFREVLDQRWIALTPEEKKGIGMTEEWQMTQFAAALKAATDLWQYKKMKDPVVGDKWDFQTKARMVESCAIAFKHWQEEKKKGRVEILSVEQNFAVPIEDGLWVGGKKDVTLRWNGGIWVRDYKTSSKEQNHYYVRTLDPNDQFTRYTYGATQLAGEPVQGVLVEVLYNGKGTKKEPKKGPEIHTHMTSRSPSQVSQWVKEQVQINKHLVDDRNSDVWPMEEKHCPFCIFHSVCTKGTEYAQMAKLEAEFKVEPWDFQARDVDSDL